MRGGLPKRLPTTHAALLLAVLALCASPVQAACTPGYLEVNLVSHSGGSCGSNLFARCLSSFRIAVDAGCAVQLTPLAGGGAYAPAIWSTNAAGTYTQLSQCPTAASAAVSTNADPLAADLKAAVQTALERHIYGSSYPVLLSSVVWDRGTIALTASTDGCQLRYGITAINDELNSITAKLAPDAAEAVCETDGALSVGSECQLSLGVACGAGRQPVTLTGSTKACPLCSAGSYSGDGASCTPCSAGKHASSAGAADCDTACVAGTYAPSTGYSECLPCPAGQYQSGTGQDACSTCPAGSYARVPGATQCVKCVAGIARCAAGTGCTADGDAASPGYHVLSVASPGELPQATCNLDPSLSFGSPPLFGQCTLAASPPTALSIFVDRECAVSIVPMGDTACAQPGNSSYWSSMRIRGFYVSPTKIVTTLGASTSSYLLTLEQASPTTLTLQYWPATTSLSAATAVESAADKSCSGTLEVTGGQVGSVPSTPASCAAGSYNAATGLEDGCRACPVGAYCPASATAPSLCAAGTYQPYLGQADAGACLNCPSPLLFTSSAGSDDCSVPYTVSCPSGSEPNDAGDGCNICPAGTRRNAASSDYCLPCPPGQYSSANASSCTPCPLDQFSPVYGMVEQDVSGSKKCWYCPTGTVAIDDNDAVGQTGSTFCAACPPGTTAAANVTLGYKSCQACADGYYRPGWGSATSNSCRQIPNGWKESDRTATAYDRAQIETCDRGEVAAWSGGVRGPLNPQACSPCGGITNAPRRGMAACQNCTAGTVPSKSVPQVPGFDQCTACSDSTYRPANSSSSTCLVCTAGKEAHPSSQRSCDPCAAGWYMPDVNGGANLSLPAIGGSCLPCPANSYQNATGQASCMLCPAGTSTNDTGNPECNPCFPGSYAPSAASACVPAPPGAYVNTTGATGYTLCPLGRYSNSLGSEECEICTAGQYSNLKGARGCKTCVAGTYSGSAASTCIRCKPGYYASSGSSSCTPCKPGTYSDLSGLASCTPCPIAKQCPTTATRVPQDCPRGQYGSRQGLRLCIPCRTNTYQDLRGQRGCKPCPGGYTTRGLTGQSVCQPSRSMGRRLRL
ncbi:hypothetical protein D9Q98_009112 [Chlorella vulgaris]|uniref:TNFR-Cys domain-containing protein n=1 Tax=Chlorella vulgaris TaxID=3077 RepID=A0A9D4YTH9_CHLVU|nr:hypothetical protein D9Q98_009112 [Chlorella vulgaris]